MEKRITTGRCLVTLAATFSVLLTSAVCQTVCPRRCSCYLGQQPRTVMCARQGLEAFPENISDVVEQLNLSNNLLTDITSDINRLIDLQYLILSKNRLSSLPEDISNLKSLKKLDLSWNQIHTIVDISSVRQLPALKFLYLSKNPLSSLEDLVNGGLEVLSVTHCEIREFSNTSLDGLPALTTLSLAGNPLKFIQKARSPKLRWLDMSDCLLNFLSPDTFSGFPELEELRMANNPTLVYSTRHETLTHSNLKRLDVSRCNLDRPGLHGLPSLVHARLTRNSIRLLPDRIFAKNRQLGFLYLNTNSLESLNASTFEGMVELQVLDLSANNLETIDPLAFHENIELKQLNLSYNNLQEFPNLTSAVMTLDLSSNQISKLSQNFLTGMPKIKSIILTENRLETIPSPLVSTTLKNLDLRRNRLVEVDNNTFLRLPQLIRIDLSGNRLTEAMSPNIFRNNPGLNIIKLGDNPWRCDCKELAHLFNYLTELPAKTLSTSLICQTPANMSGYSWESACFDAWNGPFNKDRSWGFVLIVILTVIVLSGSFISFRHMIRMKRRALDQRQQLEALRLLRRRRVHTERQREERVERQPEPRIHPLELLGPPSYEEAIQMPRLARSLDNLDEISADTSSVRVMGSADNLRTKQRRTRRIKTRIYSEDDWLRREGRRQERIKREINASVGNVASEVPQVVSQTTSRTSVARRPRKHSVLSDSVDSSTGKLRTRPQTPSAKKKRRRRTVYDGHSSDDEDSDIPRYESTRSMVIRELRREPKSGYREPAVDHDT
ncbi:leucine-rich repeat protein SHOC-2 [Hylaeus volcanicus]|uniref:leucine-rich repeat protein SHOC-2 n=1 Tax=Hylaeus volcanicus TaxID=313075 RepID=UPI0023B86878|nr:leucine-rich repeat protein SHOC-2 [Hylaeus volcanicus]